jgi:20S proteasome alpha/beta subunit
MHDRSSIVKHYFNNSSSPLKHVIPLRPPQKRGAKMTIGMGFKCANGVVLLSDCQITIPQILKDYQSKLHLFGHRKISIASVYSGTPNIALAMVKSLERGLAENDPKTEDKIIALIKSKIKSLAKEYPEPMRAQEFLYAISSPNKMPRFLHIQDSVMDEPEWSCIGIGETALIRYLLASLNPLPIKVLDTKAAFSLGIYMIRQAKLYIDGCGGSTDAVIASPDGAIRVLSGDQADKEELRMDEFTIQSKELFMGMVRGK